MLTSPTDKDFTLHQYGLENKLPVSQYGAKVSFVFVDVETTGLNEHDEDHILELAMVSTTDIGEVVDAFQCFVWGDDSWSDSFNNMPEVVKKMHDESGLTKAHDEWFVKLYDTDRYLPKQQTKRNVLSAAMWMQRQSLARAEHEPKLLMAGNSIRFDRMMLTKDFPELHELFHYRSIDVSTLKELAKIFKDDVALRVPDVIKLAEGLQHRALTDCAASIREYRHYLYNWLWEEGLTLD